VSWVESRVSIYHWGFAVRVFGLPLRLRLLRFMGLPLSSDTRALPAAIATGIEASPLSFSREFELDRGGVLIEASCGHPQLRR